MIEKLYFTNKSILNFVDYGEFFDKYLVLEDIIFSTMSYVLYSPKHQATAGQKVELFTKFIDLPITFERIGTDKTKSPEYLAKHPLGKVPCL